MTCEILSILFDGLPALRHGLHDDIEICTELLGSIPQGVPVSGDCLFHEFRVAEKFLAGFLQCLICRYHCTRNDYAIFLKQIFV